MREPQWTLSAFICPHGKKHCSYVRPSWWFWLSSTMWSPGRRSAGIRPEVARLLVARGDDLGAIMTFGSLQSGIVHARKSIRAAAAR